MNYELVERYGMWYGRKKNFPLLIFAGLLLFPCVTVQAADVFWTGSGDGQSWFDASNWSSGETPGSGDSVTIDSGTVMLTNSVSRLSSLTVEGVATLVFSNWYTKLAATNVLVGNGGTVTHAEHGATAVDGTGEWPLEARVWIECVDFTVEAGGWINVDACGYIGGSVGSETGKGPGGGPFSDVRWGAGGSHGNRGGAGYRIGTVERYGITNAPVLPGSGGGGQTTGRGGGVVLVEASGDVLLNGSVSADGAPGAGGGSGGSILIICNMLSGSGNISAAGGNAANRYGGGGAGGRIAISYDSVSQLVAGPPNVGFSLAGGAGDPDDHGKPGGSGTLYLPDSAVLQPDLGNFVGVRIYGVTNWATDYMSVSHPGMAFSEKNFTLVVSNRLSINNADFEIGSGISGSDYVQLDCLALVLSNAASFSIYSGPTNGFNPEHGALINVTGDMTVYSNCWVMPYSNPTNGGSVHFTVGSVLIHPYGGFDADAKGFAAGGADGIDGYGPGRGIADGLRGGGGGYGGKGGRGATGGDVCGYTNAPSIPGSGGGAIGGSGGGLVYIHAYDTIYLGGVITANGQNGGRYTGGGAGGGIFLIADNAFEVETNAFLSASGGTAGDQGGGGGGGRIALWNRIREYFKNIIFTDPDNAWANISRLVAGQDFEGEYSVAKGVDANLNDAEPGTFVVLSVPPAQGVIFISD